jgi:putative transposon-encoded protein
MIEIDSTTAKKLILKSSYERIYTEKVKTNGGNSGKINCKGEYIGQEALVFILSKTGGKKDG